MTKKTANKILFGLLCASLFLWGRLAFLTVEKERSALKDLAAKVSPLMGGDLPIEKQKAKEGETKKLPSGENTVPKKGSVKILFLGDVMLDRYIRTVAEKKGKEFIFEGLKNHLATADLAVANLEGPITDEPSRSAGSELGSKDNYYFTFDPKWVPVVKNSGLDVLFLGNNHIFNFGAEGLAQTREHLDQGDLEYFGDPENPDKYYEGDKNGWKVALVGYDFTSEKAEEKTLSNIARAENDSHLTVVYAHWGIEYEEEIGSDQRALAHRFIEAGADLVVGSHPHVIQPVETYQDKAIFYSLGNAIFDQYFSRETQEGLSVLWEIGPEGDTAFSLVPLFLPDGGQTVPAESDRQKIVLERLAKTSFVDDETKNGIRSGFFQLSGQN